MPLQVKEMKRKVSFRLLIRKVERPYSGAVNDDLDWICESLGFFGPGPRENAAYVFKEIVKATEKGTGLTSTDLAHKLDMSRGSAINHINNLLASGLVVKQGRFYFARSRSMQRTIEELEDEIDLLFERMKKVAGEIDSDFGIRQRK